LKLAGSSIANERCGGHDTDTGDRHQQLVGGATPCVREKLASKLCGAEANGVLGFTPWTDDLAQISIVGEQRMNMMLELAAHHSRNDETERLHQAPDLVLQFRANPHEASPCRNQRAREHAVETPDPHLLVEPSAICASPSASLASVLFAAMSRAALACRASIQIAGTPSAASANEPNRERASLEKNYPLGCRR
jgi:hypothetical protein